MSNLFKFLSLVIFVSLVWIVNLILLPRVNSDLKILEDSKSELAVKKTFNDNSPETIYKSINAFVLQQFDKNQVINLIDSFALESNIDVLSLDITPSKSSNNSQEISLEENLDVAIDTLSMEEGASQSNTLKIVDFKIDIQGSKNSIDSFISKLVNSKQYIDIQNINTQFLDSSNASSNLIQSTIIAKIYYIKL
jgi:hypothetical protein